MIKSAVKSGLAVFAALLAQGALAQNAAAPARPGTPPPAAAPPPVAVAPAAVAAPAPVTAPEPVQPVRRDPPPPVNTGMRPYTINPGDEIEVYVWGEERLQRAIKVLPDGTFSFPLVGRVAAVGMLPGQIEDAISRGLESQYRGAVPNVTVSVKAAAGLQFSVVGRVKAAGTFNPGRYVNLLEAISLAGGPDEYANLDNVTIVRKTPNGLTSIRAKLGGMFKNGPGARDLAPGAIPAVESGDTVIVP